MKIYLALKAYITETLDRVFHPAPLTAEEQRINDEIEEELKVY